MRRLATGTLVLLLLVLGWFGLAPTQVGGSNSYVTTYGDSMEPGFHAGDLAVVRHAGDYRVGDVIAYHSGALGIVVMHRIVAVENGRYTLQGDNNRWLDPDHPTRERLIGRLALRIPQGGIWLDRLISPPVLGLLAVGLLAGGGQAVQRRRHRRRTHMSQHMTRDRRNVPVGGLPPWGMSAWVAVALAAVLGVLLAAPAWTTTPGEAAKTDDHVAQTMTFSYRTTVRPSAAYDDTVVTSPDPVFRNLAQTVDVRYSYRGRPGSIAVRAELSTAGGWHSTVPLRPTASSADDHSGTVRLDLKELEDRAQAAAAATGIPAADVEIAVVPTVTAADGTTFEPSLTLVLTPLQLTLAGEETSLTVTDAASPVSTTTTGPGTLSIAGRDVSVSTARAVSLVLLLGALLAALGLGLLSQLGTRSSEGSTIRRRYSPILIQVQPMPTPAGRPVVDVVDFATLAKLAQRYGLLVMHWSRSNVETFVVQDEGTTYRYRTGTGGAHKHAEVTVERV